MTETKTQQTERLKRVKNPWDALERAIAGVADRSGRLSRPARSALKRSVRASPPHALPRKRVTCRRGESPMESNDNEVARQNAIQAALVPEALPTSAAGRAGQEET